eukprot:1164213-Pyramimonas_sp.AAC.1
MGFCWVVFGCSRKQPFRRVTVQPDVPGVWDSAEQLWAVMINYVKFWKVIETYETLWAGMGSYETTNNSLRVSVGDVFAKRFATSCMLQHTLRHTV